ncbi:MAG: C-GCAxxG-C-C family (seleno)protein [Eubacteriales bacterium]|nr:C-GCAxxG-C-C family (seleno)protein [Eubacteriales bacterium]
MDLTTQAVEVCEQYRRKGFACSESVFRALTDIYNLKVPMDTYQVISVFAGGGIDDGRCGVVEAGLFVISILFKKGKLSRAYSLEELSVQLHQEFVDYYGGYNCRDIFYPLYEEHKRSLKGEADFFCAFHDGITIITSFIESKI